MGGMNLKRDASVHVTKTGLMIFSEIAVIALFPCYFLVVAILPERWLDTAIGAIAFAIASKLNPFLSEYSIAFAYNPRYFIHCHVLATWMLTFTIGPLFVSAYGGVDRTKSHFREVARKRTVWFLWAVPVFVSMLYVTFLWMGPTYPLGRAARGVWESVTVFASIHAAAQSLVFYAMYFAIPLTWKHIFGSNGD